MNLFDAWMPWNSLDDVPVHLHGQVKRARDARLYADVTVPRTGDLVTIRYGTHAGQPGMVTSVNLPTVYFTYPDGVEFSSGIRGIEVISESR